MRTTVGLVADGRPWELRRETDRATAVMAGRPVGEARVSERGDLVVIELWVEEAGVPAEVPAGLVTWVFARPQVRPPRPVLVCVPRHDGGLLALARRRVRDARTRAAGGTCLVEGYVAGPGGVPGPR